MTHCTSRCRSKRHAYDLNAIIQNGTLEQAQACLATCSNAFRGFDINGRNLLHVAAANGECFTQSHLNRQHRREQFQAHILNAYCYLAFILVHSVTAVW